MMTTLHKAHAEDFERIYPLLQQFNNPNLTKEDWRQLFVSHWGSRENHFGFFLLEGEQVVGFLGTLFSRRQINGIPHDFCNLSTWIVKEDYRGMSLMLLFEALKQEGYTITNLTANKVAGILIRFGFKDLALTYSMVLPVLLPAVLLPGLKITEDKQAIEAQIKGEARSVFLDHKDMKCRHMLIQGKGRQCYLIFDIIKKKGLPVMRIHHISNPAWFASNAYRISPHACLQTGTFGMLVNNNLLHGSKVWNAFQMKQLHRMVYKSDTLSSQDIDMAYSELQLFGLKS
jgi:hypothetical protein